MEEKVTLERAGEIIRELAPRIPLTERRIYPLPQLPGTDESWWVWVAFATVEPHTDRPEPGWVTRGLIIINDQRLKLFLDEPHRTYWDLNSGDAYRVFPENLHGVCTQEHTFTHTIPAQFTPSLFAALIRDYPADQNPSYEGFKEQALSYLAQWCDRVEITNFQFYKE